jgi:uncharacterized protein
MLKAVIDTNVFVSGLLSRTGPPARVIEAWRDGEFMLVVSPAIVAEIRRVLTSPRIRDGFSVRPADAAALVELLEEEALLVPGLTQVNGAVPQDPADEKFLSRHPNPSGSNVSRSALRHEVRESSSNFPLTIKSGAG